MTCESDVPWQNLVDWGDGLAAKGKRYSSLGDRDAQRGNAFVYEYDPTTEVMRLDKHDAVDREVTLPHGKGQAERTFR